MRMAPTELLPHLQRRPFVPFRIVSSDAKNYDIRHPEMVMILPTAAMVAYPNEQVPGTYLRVDFVSMFHIVRIEMPDAAPSSQGNGEQSA
jgi:hypothetical protein